MVANRFFIIVAVISLIAAGITMMLGWFFRRKRIIKYIPAILTAVAGIGFIIKSRYFSQGFEDLGYIVLAMIAGVAFAASLVTALVMEFVGRKRV